ncbi:hypothetical protein NLJ89_g8203 [Agrocybe chaxingu]|uniref:Uncharacterized protein n=1 Tax=Agrocybe chaxingu TaxID=84603 RepID=A0A9W8JUW0_9AGAR|nr:hypothetical protein NLJ89_g8203 [Agrocybe chaxingu]
MPVADSEIHSGKVRKILFHPGSFYAIIFCKEFLYVWDTRRNTPIWRIALDLVPLDACWMNLTPEQPASLLAVLSDNGKLACFSLNGLFFPVRVRKQESRMHKASNNPAVYGVLTCANEMIASSLGGDVTWRNLSQGRQFETLAASQIFVDPKHHGYITQLQLLTSTRLLIFNALWKIVIDYEISSKTRSAIIDLEYHP